MHAGRRHYAMDVASDALLLQRWVAWPLKEHAVVNADVVFMQLSLDVVSIDELLHAVVDPSNWEAIPVEWCP
eukprot:7911432-Pyramimonas_sp.AAC.1